MDERLQLSGALEVMADGLLNVPWPSNCGNSIFQDIIKKEFRKNLFEDVLDGTLEYLFYNRLVHGDIYKSINGC